MSTHNVPALTGRSQQDQSTVEPGRSACRTCGGPAARIRRGQCTPCYLRSLAERKAAGIFHTRRAATTPLARLLTKVIPGPRPTSGLHGGCWLYTGSATPRGYGQFALDGRNVRAHRAAYRLLIGDVVDGHPLPHLCRVRLCVNPAHLDPADGSTAAGRGEAARAAIRALTATAAGGGR